MTKYIKKYQLKNSTKTIKRLEYNQNNKKKHIGKKTQPKPQK
jgi:hypothetical protein